MADTLGFNIRSVFPPSRTAEYTISGEYYSTHSDTTTYEIYLFNPTTLAASSIKSGPALSRRWAKFEVTTTVDGSQFTGLIIALDFAGVILGTRRMYLRNIQATTLTMAHVSTTDILNAGRLNHAYNGCKMTALDFNVPSPDTPDGGPVVEINFVNPNSPTAAPAELDELDAALYTARTGRALVNIVPQPDPNPSSSERTVDPARALANRSSERAVDPGRAIINRSGEARRLVNRNTTDNSNNT